MKRYLTTFFTVAVAAALIIPGSVAGMTLDDINIHGFISQGYLDSTEDMEFLVEDSEKGTFEFNEMAMNVSASPSDDLTVGMQLYAYDMGSIGNDEVIVDWAFGDYSLTNWLGLRFGIMKIPYGLYNETRKIDMVRASILLPSSVYPEWFREAFARIKGAGVYGALPGNFSYQAVYGNIDIAADSGLADGLESLGESLSLETSKTETDYAFAGKLEWDSPFGLKLAGSFYKVHGFNLRMGNTSFLPPMTLVPGTAPLPGMPVNISGEFQFDELKSFVVSAEYVYDRLTLAAEYSELDLDFLFNITTNLDPAVAAAAGIPPGIQDTPTLQGYYGSIAYRVLDQLELGTYYSVLYYDKYDHGGRDFAANYGKQKEDGWLKDLCISARLDITTNWCAKIEAHFMDGMFLATNASADDWALYAAKVTYSF